jgi:hypothetical protein
LPDEPVDWVAVGNHVSLTFVGMNISKSILAVYILAPRNPLKLALGQEQ